MHRSARRHLVSIPEPRPQAESIVVPSPMTGKDSDYPLRSFYAQTIPGFSNGFSTAVTAAIAAGADSAEAYVEIPEDGVIVGLSGSVVDVGAITPAGLTYEAAMSIAGMKVCYGPERSSLFTDGQGVDRPISFAESFMFGKILPLSRRAQQKWRVRFVFSNLSSVSSTLKCRGTVWFRADSPERVAEG